MSIRAGFDRVLVIPEDVSEELDSGLIIAPAHTENPTTGIIESIGDGVEHEGQLAEGDRVAFADMAGSEFVWQGVKYYALEYREILAVLPEE